METSKKPHTKETYTREEVLRLLKRQREYCYTSLIAGSSTNKYSDVAREDICKAALNIDKVII